MTATAFRIAVRDARAARGKFLFVIVAVALGVGSLTGVRGFSQAFASMLLREARVHHGRRYLDSHLWGHFGRAGVDSRRPLQHGMSKSPA